MNSIPDSKCRVSFSAAYWLRNADIDFSQQSLGDPVVQTEQQRIRNTHLIHKWGSLGLEVPEELRQASERIDPVVKGYGVATLPMILGCEAIFSPGHDPYAKPLDLDDEAVMALTPRTDYSDNPVMQDLEEQAQWLKKSYGRAKIAINMQSVPNIAFKLRGEQLMTDFFENPAIVHKLLEYLQQTWVNLRSYISDRNDALGCPNRENMVSLDNCTVALLSPTIYRDFFLPYDRKTAAYYRTRYGVHHCGGNMHLFAEDYATMGEGIWFDIGYGSAVEDCMRKLACGTTPPQWSVRYGPAKLQATNPDEIRREKEYLKQCGATNISCVGVDPDTPTENLRTFLAQ